MYCNGKLNQFLDGRCKKNSVYKKCLNKNYLECIRPEKECTFPFQYITIFELGNLWNP